MIRQTIFRGKRVDGEGWIEGYLMTAKEDLNSNGMVMCIQCLETFIPFEVIPETIGQYTGLKDKNGKRYFIGDKGRFSNVDSFVLKMEEWLEVYIEWIGEPECSDQARDLYRISSAEITGNIYDTDNSEEG